MALREPPIALKTSCMAGALPIMFRSPNARFSARCGNLYALTGRADYRLVNVKRFGRYSNAPFVGDGATRSIMS